jgi:predicted ABC-type ATPase
MNTAALLKKYELTDKQLQQIQNRIIKTETYKKLPVAFPKAIILGAQPGSGKTELQKIAEQYFKYSAVICNPDNFRDFHPKALEIKQHHEKLYPEITSKYAHHWNAGLQKHCRQNKLNYILETNFKDGQQLNQTMSAIKAHDFSVDIMLLAVNATLSKIGIHARFEDQKHAKNFGRSVSVLEHDMRYNAIPLALKEVADAGLYNNISIYGRNIFVDGDQYKSGVHLIAKNPTGIFSAADIFLKERNRILSQKEKAFLQMEIKNVVSLMEKRNAAAEDINAFKQSVGIVHSIKKTFKR